MGKFNVIHPSCKQDRYEIQNDGNDWHIDEKNEPIRILGGEILFDKYGIAQPSPKDIPDFETSRPVDWVKIAQEAPIKNTLADGGESALLIVPSEQIGGEIGIRR